MTTEHRPRVVFDRRGFRLEKDGAIAADMDWSAIRSIWAYKIDLFSVDLLVLGFSNGHGAEQIEIEVDEEFSGFAEFREEVERRFAVAPGWWQAVIFPAFATNLTRLWPIG